MQLLEDDSGSDVSSVCSENNVSYQQSSSDSEIDEVVPSAFTDTHEPIRTAKDGTKWVQLHQSVAGRVSTANIFLAIPGIASASIKASVTTALPRGSRSPTSNPCCGRGLPRANRGVRFYYNIQQQHQLLQTQNTISNNRVFDKPDH